MGLVRGLIGWGGLLGSVAALAQDAKPLPATAELRARAVSNAEKTSAARERFLCRLRAVTQSLDSKGNVKKTETEEREVFFVNGQEIGQTISKDGRPLSAGEQHKEDEAVRKRIEAATRHKRETGQLRIADLLKLATLTNERRVEVAGRPTIVFDVVPSPQNKGNGLAGRFVADMAGTVSIDEATGILQDANVRGVNDIKVGGGLLANVHKGFSLHLVTAPQVEGVWLLKTIDGQGDARVGLLVHEGGRFHQETEGCRVYEVSSEQKGDAVHGAVK